MINYQTNDIKLEKFMDVKALRDRIQEIHDSGDCGHMLSDVLEMANKICSNSSEANFAWLASALEQYAKGDVITVPAGTGTEEEFFAWLKNQPDKPARITEQDVREIAESVVGYVGRGNVDYWFRDFGGRELLNKLNADREQVPAVAKAIELLKVAERLFRSLNHDPDRELQSKECRRVIADLEIIAPPSHSQQSAESDLEIVQAALDKTGLELRVGKDWILVCGEDEYSGDDALEVYYKDWAALLTWAKQADTDRCPSHDSEQEDNL